MKINKNAMVAAVIATMVAAGNAAVLTFDDVTATPYDVIPNGYGGFNWNNMYVGNQNYMLGTGYDYGTVSGDYTAFNGGGNVAAVSSSAFDFLGAYLTAAWNIGLNINLKGYNGASLLYDQTIVVDPYAPTWFNFNYYNIDQLVLISAGGVGAGLGEEGTQFAMDDFTYAIPEPSSIAMIGLVSGFGVFIRKRFML